MLSQNSSTSSLFSYVIADKGGRKTGMFLNKMDEFIMDPVFQTVW